MSKPRLGVNIDHVATLRQQRGEDYPSVVEAANLSLINGADQITIHLREDRRHIQDTDVEAVHLVTKRYGKPLNLEMGCHPEMIEIAIASNPEWICLVPEKRQEKTTEGGLDLRDDTTFKRVEEACKKLKDNIKNVQISLFLEADPEILNKAFLLQADAVEIHTGEYAKRFLNGEDIEQYILKFKAAKELIEANKWGCHAGHGLTLESVEPLLENKLFVEYNIGHWIIAQAIFEGLPSVIKKFRTLFDR